MKIILISCLLMIYGCKRTTEVVDKVVSCNIDEKYLLGVDSAQKQVRESTVYVTKLWGEVTVDSRYSTDLTGCAAVACKSGYELMTNFQKLIQENDLSTNEFLLTKDSIDGICVPKVKTCSVGDVSGEKTLLDFNVKNLVTTDASLENSSDHSLLEAWSYSECQIPSDSNGSCGNGLSLNSSVEPAVCVQSQKTCSTQEIASISGAIDAIKTWNTSLNKYESCQASACSVGYALMNGACIAGGTCSLLTDVVSCQENILCSWSDGTCIEGLD